MYVEFSAQQDKFNKQLDGLKGQLTGMGQSINVAVGNIATSIFLGTTAAVGNFISRGIEGAANLGESISKVEQVFGDSSETIISMSDEMATKFGLPKQALLDAAASIGLVGQAAGQTQAQAADMGVKMAKLAADASSFYNVPLEDALNKIRSGLVGESEPMRAFGVLLSEEAVALEAVRMGLAGSTKEVDNQDKVMARASLITAGLAKANGDLERTADSTSNQYRKFTGALENAAVSMGTALLPAVNVLINMMGDMVSEIAATLEANKESVTTWAQWVGDQIRQLPAYWDMFQAGLQIAILKAEQFGINVMEVFKSVPENAGILVDWLTNVWIDLYMSVFDEAFNIIDNFAINSKGIWTALTTFFSTGKWEFNKVPLKDVGKAFTEALSPQFIKPHLTSMAGAIEAVGDDLAAKNKARGDAAKAKAFEEQSATTKEMFAMAMAGTEQHTATAKAAVSAAEAKKAAPGIAFGSLGLAAFGMPKSAFKEDKEKPFTVQSMGIADVYTNLRQSIFSDKDDKPAQTLKATERVAVATEAIAENTKKPAAAVLGP